MSTLEEAEQVGRQAAEKLGARSLADLRMKSAEEIQKGLPGGRPIVDGWYLTDDTSTLIAEGKSNDVDVLVGSNRDEEPFLLRRPRGNAQEFTAAVRQRFGSQADAFLKLYYDELRCRVECIAAGRVPRRSGMACPIVGRSARAERQGV